MPRKKKFDKEAAKAELVKRYQLSDEEAESLVPFVEKGVMVPAWQYSSDLDRLKSDHEKGLTGLRSELDEARGTVKKQVDWHNANHLPMAKELEIYRQWFGEIDPSKGPPPKTGSNGLTVEEVDKRLADQFEKFQEKMGAQIVDLTQGVQMAQSRFYQKMGRFMTPDEVRTYVAKGSELAREPEKVQDPVAFRVLDSVFADAFAEQDAQRAETEQNSLREKIREEEKAKLQDEMSKQQFPGAFPSEDASALFTQPSEDKPPSEAEQISEMGTIFREETEKMAG